MPGRDPPPVGPRPAGRSGGNAGRARFRKYVGERLLTSTPRDEKRRYGSPRRPITVTVSRGGTLNHKR